MDADSPGAPFKTESSGLIFISDPSAEAERHGAALRSRGYAVVDVPFGHLENRIRLQRPALVLCDADTPGALALVETLAKPSDGPSIQVVLLGAIDGTIDSAKARLQELGAVVFHRPAEVYALVRRVEALIGAAGRLGSASVKPMDRAPVLVASARKPYRSDTATTETTGEPSQPIGAVAPVSPDSAPTSSLSTLGVHRSFGSQRPQFAASTPKSLMPEPPHVGAALPPAWSPELSQLLGEAEQRLEDNRLFDSQSRRLPPEAELDLVLPPEVLDVLDEPLDEEDDPELEEGRGTNGGSDAHGTAPGTGGGTGTSTGAGRGPTPSRTPPPGQKLQDPSAAQLTNPGGVSRAGPATMPPIASEAGGARTSAPPPSMGTHLETHALAPPSSELPSSLPPTTPPRRPPPEPPPAEEPEQRISRPSTIPPASATTEGAPSTPQPTSFASAVRQRATGALVYESRDGSLCRIVLRDGDVVTVASGIREESLLAFLVERGDLDSEVASGLASKIPWFGRHAGAALIANGHLRQDELWNVLRSHAEWLLVRIGQRDRQEAEWEENVPERLQAEPSVFGGATGAEVLVETFRRALTPERALQQLRGTEAKLVRGSNWNLLGECALNPEESAVVNSLGEASVGALLGHARAPEFAAVLVALVDLGVLNHTAAPVELSIPQPEEDPLDDQALRARVAARRALVAEGDYFALLGVTRGATQYDIQKAYEALKRELEPSRVLTARNADLSEDVDLVLEVLDEAYQVLHDENRRERYRRALEAAPG